jgi:hypothetical protein
MTPAEIISNDAERSGKRPGAALHGVSVAVDKRGAKVLHDDRSVVVVEPIRGSKAKYSLHLFTADSPIGLVRSVKNLVPQIQKIPGLEFVYGDTENPQLVRLIRAAGVDVLKSDNQKFTWMAKA